MPFKMLCHELDKTVPDVEWSPEYTERMTRPNFCQCRLQSLKLVILEAMVHC